jgi:hypothetical protein
MYFSYSRNPKRRWQSRIFNYAIVNNFALIIKHGEASILSHVIATQSVTRHEEGEKPRGSKLRSLLL